MTIPSYSLKEAYEYCRRIAASHYENFPVGSFLIPKKLRKHFFALYAFMRSADDFADLPTRNSSDRLQLLYDWKRQLDEITAGKESQNLIFVALSNTIKECNLPIPPLYKLLEAFEFDAKGEVNFETFEDLQWYTSRSANPVGELILALFGYRNADNIALSNEICTALQLLNFIQDIREDLTNQRYYYPQEDCQIFGFDPVGRTLSPSLDQQAERLALISLFELERVEGLLNHGTHLAESVRGRLRYELRAVIHAARKMIAIIRRLDGNTYSERPTLSKSEHGVVLLQSIFFRVK